jgi:hypothetical protein
MCLLHSYLLMGYVFEISVQVVGYSVGEPLRVLSD